MQNTEQPKKKIWKRIIEIIAFVANSILSYMAGNQGIENLF
jgi:hypothetical protein